MAAELLTECGSSDLFVISFDEETPFWQLKILKRILGFTSYLKEKKVMSSMRRNLSTHPSF